MQKTKYIVDQNTIVRIEKLTSRVYYYAYSKQSKKLINIDIDMIKLIEFLHISKSMAQITKRFNIQNLEIIFKKLLDDQIIINQ